MGMTKFACARYLEVFHGANRERLLKQNVSKDELVAACIADVLPVAAPPARGRGRGRGRGGRRARGGAREGRGR